MTDIEAIRARHFIDAVALHEAHAEYCGHCRKPWPCDTVVALAVRDEVQQAWDDMLALREEVERALPIERKVNEVLSAQLARINDKRHAARADADALAEALRGLCHGLCESDCACDHCKALAAHDAMKADR